MPSHPSQTARRVCDFFQKREFLVISYKGMLVFLKPFTHCAVLTKMKSATGLFMKCQSYKIFLVLLVILNGLLFIAL